ncbi:Scr1 family TA system antitoxin-like transcriptional regulator [Streptomyces sp. NPDC096040]|uniref:Scr1 family TA system antitoxin-like transcriptional regulator n=1 Tax=Streptomyces sp. NPDC096040 TaxID=3155541 RepID=UPI003321339B
MPQRRVVTGRSQEPRQRFAEELRHLRAERGVSLRELAEELGWDASNFGKMESGRSLGSPEIVEALDQSAVKFLRLPDGRTVAYTENDLRGELVEEIASVVLLLRRHDAMRDLALSPVESRKFILRMLEEVPCEPST